MPRLAGGRIVLRPIDEADAPGVLSIFGDPEVVRYWSRPPLPDLAAANTFLDEMQEDFFRRRSFHWGIAEAAPDGSQAGALIGTFKLGALSFRHRRAEIGFLLRRDRWGQGLAAEALAVMFGFCFGRLGLHRLEADVDPENAPSLRLLEKLGFQREGRLRERWQAQGDARDAIFLGLLRPEWRSP
ncbi:MAG TPA: GNAT family N-acetyltransferase [Polyangia bacterium]|nr:GNAT family N-acetyltransferase [Polyangia bacterium]